MGATCSSIQASLEGFVGQELKQKSTDWQKQLLHISDKVCEFSVTHKDKVGQAEKMVDKYINQELQQDIPTGKCTLMKLCQ